MKRHKRRIGRLTIIAVAIVGAMWTASPALAAAPTGDNIPGGEAEFKRDCGLGGGTFRRDASTGTIFCTYSDGTVIICDKGAKNCKVFKPTRLSPTGYNSTEGAGDAFYAR